VQRRQCPGAAASLPDLDHRPRISSLPTFLALAGLVLLPSLPATSLAAPPPGAAAGAETTPVLFVPFIVSRPFASQEVLLREMLSTRMIATGRYSESVSAGHEKAVQQCVRAVNRDVNAETCWIRLGQGQGARMMVDGRISGDAQSCSVVLRLTALESRLSVRKHASVLEPCGGKALVAEMDRAAMVLAGQSLDPAAVAGVTLGSPSPLAGPLSPAATAGGGLAVDQFLMATELTEARKGYRGSIAAAITGYVLAAVAFGVAAAYDEPAIRYGMLAGGGTGLLFGIGGTVAAVWNNGKVEQLEHQLGLQPGTSPPAAGSPQARFDPPPLAVGLSAATVFGLRWVF